MKSNVVSLQNYKFHKELVSPTKRLLESLTKLKEEVSGTPKPFVEVVHLSLENFVENTPPLWVGVCKHFSNSDSGGKVWVHYGSVLDDKADSPAVSIGYLGTCSDEVKRHSVSLADILKNIPDRHSEHPCGLFELVGPIITLISSIPNSLIHFEEEDDYDIMYFDFAYKHRLLRLIVNNKRLDEIAEEVCKISPEVHQDE